MRKKILALLLCSLVFSCGITVNAQEVNGDLQRTVQTEIQPRADVIVTKYRVYNHKLQKRRWNETRGYWVDPYWITIAVAE